MWVDLGLTLQPSHVHTAVSVVLRDVGLPQAARAAAELLDPHVLLYFNSICNISNMGFVIFILEVWFFLQKMLLQRLGYQS